MRRANITVFDDHVKGTQPPNLGLTVFTSQELNAKLGHFDQMAIQVVVDNLNAVDGFDLWVQHSSDGRNWLYVLSPAHNPPQGTDFGDVSSFGNNMSTSVANNFWGFPGATNNSTQGPTGNPNTSLLAFVRFQLYFHSTSTSGHVRVHVTQRDQG
jgi:hypothetical protein